MASWQCATNDWGHVSSSEPQTLRQALTLSLSFYKYQSAIVGEKERKKLIFVCLPSILPVLSFIHIFGV